jgi:hypothetical protein
MLGEAGRPVDLTTGRCLLGRSQRRSFVFVQFLLFGEELIRDDRYRR